MAKVPNRSSGRRALDSYLENARADLSSLKASHRVDLVLGKSPKLGVKVAGIFVYNQHRVSDPSERLARIAEGMPPDEEGEYLLDGEPVMIADPEGVRVGEICRIFFATIDKYGGKADARLVVPDLHIAASWSVSELAVREPCVETASRLIKDAYTFYDRGFEWDRKNEELVRFRGRKAFQTPITVGSTGGSD